MTCKFEMDIIIQEQYTPVVVNQRHDFNRGPRRVKELNLVVVFLKKVIINEKDNSYHEVLLSRTLQL